MPWRRGTPLAAINELSTGATRQWCDLARPQRGCDAVCAKCFNSSGLFAGSYAFLLGSSWMLVGVVLRHDAPRLGATIYGFTIASTTSILAGHIGIPPPSILLDISVHVQKLLLNLQCVRSEILHGVEFLSHSVGLTA
jgi:hypothetical protein